MRLLLGRNKLAVMKKIAIFEPSVVELLDSLNCVHFFLLIKRKHIKRKHKGKAFGIAVGYILGHLYSISLCLVQVLAPHF